MQSNTYRRNLAWVSMNYGLYRDFYEQLLNKYAIKAFVCGF